MASHDPELQPLELAYGVATNPCRDLLRPWDKTCILTLLLIFLPLTLIKVSFHLIFGMLSRISRERVHRISSNLKSVLTLGIYTRLTLPLQALPEHALILLDESSPVNNIPCQVLYDHLGLQADNAIKITGSAAVWERFSIYDWRILWNMPGIFTAEGQLYPQFPTAARFARMAELNKIIRERRKHIVSHFEGWPKKPIYDRMLFQPYFDQFLGRDGIFKQETLVLAVSWWHPFKGLINRMQCSPTSLFSRFVLELFVTPFRICHMEGQWFPAGVHYDSIMQFYKERGYTVTTQRVSQLELLVQLKATREGRAFAAEETEKSA